MLKEAGIFNHTLALIASWIGIASAQSFVLFSDLSLTTILLLHLTEVIPAKILPILIICRLIGCMIVFFLLPVLCIYSC